MTHDQNFKNLILDYPRDALELFAAREVAGLDQATRIMPIREEQLKERLGDRFRELDVPLLVEWPDGSRQAILFALEEESEPRHFNIHRLAHYCLDLSELYKTNRVVPVVIFLKKGKHDHELKLGSDKENYLIFHFIGCTLAELSYEKYRESKNIVALLNLPNMRYRPEQKVDVYADALRGFSKLEPNPEKILKYIDFIDMYMALDEEERKVYYYKYPEEAKIMSTFAERFKEEGIQAGRQEEAQDMLLNALETKFQAVPQEIRERVQNLTDPSKLRELLREAILSTDLNEFVKKL